MLETPHVVVGAAIAIKVANPALALPLAFASHFVLDRVPHWNPHTYTETMKHGKPKKKTVVFSIVDISLALILGLSLAYLALPDRAHALTIVAASFLAVLPDVTKYPFFLFKETRKGLYKKWVDLERSLQVETTYVAGMTTQIVTILAAFWWIFS